MSWSLTISDTPKGKAAQHARDLLTSSEGQIATQSGPETADVAIAQARVAAEAWGQLVEALTGPDDATVKGHIGGHAEATYPERAGFSPNTLSISVQIVPANR